MSMQCKVLLRTVFRYIFENVLQFTKSQFVNPLNWRYLQEWCRTQKVCLSMKCKVSLMTVFGYIFDDVLQFTKRWFVNPPNLASMLVPMVLEGARPGAGGQEPQQGAVSPGGGGKVSSGWCPALPGQGEGMAWRDLLSAMCLQEPKLWLPFLLFQAHCLI